MGRQSLAWLTLALAIMGCGGHGTDNGTLGRSGANGGAGGIANGGAGGMANGGAGGMANGGAGGMANGGAGGIGPGGAGGIGPGGAGGMANGGGGGIGPGGAGGIGPGGTGGSGGGGIAGQGGSGDVGLGGAAGFSWHALPRLATKRQNAMAVAVGQSMYVIGGLNASGLVDAVERLDPGQPAWAPVAALPAPQCCAAAAALGTVIAIAGGYQSDGHTPTNALLLLDTATGVWQPGPPMPTARANAMGAVWNGQFAVIGGGTQYGATTATGVIEMYDPASKGWSTSPLAVTPRAGGTAVVDGDHIYVIGGSIQGSAYGNTIVEIVTAGGVTAGPPLGLARVQVTGGLLPVGLIVAGGWTATGDTPAAEALLGTRTAWQPLPPMPTSRAGAAAATVGGSLIVAGGGEYQHAAWVAQDAVEALQAD